MDVVRSLAAPADGRGRLMASDRMAVQLIDFA